MNNSSLASEFLVRAFRNIKEAKIALEDGDYYHVCVRCLEALDNIAKSILALYGVYSASDDPVPLLEYLKETRELDEELNKLIDIIQDEERKLKIIARIDEASLKGDTVIIRRKEAEIQLAEIEKVFEKAQEEFDKFHS
ncbi:MAG: HEPN domain-containing protein [Sulfolobaceae archaeon]